MKQNNHADKTSLITGASSGIGSELTKLFAQDGYNLVLVARSKKRLEHLANDVKEKYGVSTYIISKDLSKETSPDEIFAELKKKSIHIDILVNNSGTQVYGPFHETDLQNNLQMIQVNLLSLTHLTRIFIPEMLKRGYGKILNVGSTGSFGPGPLNAVYCATKSYVLNFSEAITEELKGTGVTVTTLCPGATKTEFAKRAQIEDIRLFSYEFMVLDAVEVAEIGYRALMKGKTVVVAGIVNKLMIFSLRFTPRKIVLKIIKFFMSKPPVRV